MGRADRDEPQYGQERTEAPGDQGFGARLILLSGGLLMHLGEEFIHLHPFVRDADRHPGQIHFCCDLEGSFAWFPARPHRGHSHLEKSEHAATIGN